MSFESSRAQSQTTGPRLRHLAGEFIQGLLPLSLIVIAIPLLITFQMGGDWGAKLVLLAYAAWMPLVIIIGTLIIFLTFKRRFWLGLGILATNLVAVAVSMAIFSMLGVFASR